MANHCLSLKRFRYFAYALITIALGQTITRSQTLNLPPRDPSALTGTQLTNLLSYAARDDRENWLYAQIVSGNVPGWLRTLKPINTSIAGHTGTYHVTPDYFSIGTEQDYFLTPMTPILAQRLATRFGGALPTRRMVNQIWTNATVKLNPQPIAPSAAMITMPIFAWHNYMVRTQRNAFTNSQPLGALVTGDKKDVTCSTLIYSNLNANVPKPVVIYGWHYTSGSPIQPLYNGHEETYADYSHGFRFVQSAMTVDGSPNTVTNVLQSATLQSLLSDEGVIPLPYYTVAAMAPVVLNPPRSCTVLAGETVTLDTLAAGEGSLTYRWRRNGTTISTGTNSLFSITNAQAADAGNYSVSVSNTIGVAISRTASVRVRTNSFPLLFQDDFETNSASQWDLFWASSNGLPDHSAQFAYDHSTTPYFFNGLVSPIPPAPNSRNGGTRALRLTVNNNDATGAIAAVNLYPKLSQFAGNFAVKFDLWINYPGGAGGINSTGSSQHALFGLDHIGTNANWAPASAAASDGLWFAVDGEGGTSADYRLFEGDLGGTQIERTSTLTASNNSAAIYQNLFPAGSFESAGAPGKHWVEVELRQTGNTVTWLMDGTVISQRANNSGFTAGKIMVGMMDVFPSIANPARDAFVLFDNVRVENLSPPPIRFQHVELLAGGAISLSITSAPNDVFWLESSTNYSTWQTLAVLNTTNGVASFVDPIATGFGVKYYRARR